jgi:hypothetical protein
LGFFLLPVVGLERSGALKMRKCDKKQGDTATTRRFETGKMEHKMHKNKCSPKKRRGCSLIGGGAGLLGPPYVALTKHGKDVMRWVRTAE